VQALGLLVPHAFSRDPQRSSRFDKHGVNAMTDFEQDPGGAESIAEERFQDIADRLPLIVWRLAGDHMSDWVSQEWTAVTGAPSGRATGFSWLRLVHPADRSRVALAYHEAFAEREPLGVEYRLRRRSGEFRWMLDKAVPLFRAGRFLGFVGVRMDIHRERQSDALIEEFRSSVGELMLLERDR
jgi:PAS domain S-box-containing protein